MSPLFALAYGTGSWLSRMHLVFKRYLIISDHHLSLNYEASSTRFLCSVLTSTWLENLSRVCLVIVLVMGRIP